MTSMKNVQFLHPSPPFFCLSEWVQIGQDPRLWMSKLRPPTLPPAYILHTHTHTHTHIPIPFGIYAAYRLFLVDVSITYHDRATHNSLQIKINLN